MVRYHHNHPVFIIFVFSPMLMKIFNSCLQLGDKGEINRYIRKTNKKK